MLPRCIVLENFFAGSRTPEQIPSLATNSGLSKLYFRFSDTWSYPCGSFQSITQNACRSRLSLPGAILEDESRPNLSPVFTNLLWPECCASFPMTRMIENWIKDTVPVSHMLFIKSLYPGHASDTASHVSQSALSCRCGPCGCSM